MNPFPHSGEKESQKKKKGKKPKKTKQPKTEPEQPKAKKEKPKAKPEQPKPDFLKPGPSDSYNAQASSSSDAGCSSSEAGSSKPNRRLAALRAAKALEKTGKQKRKGIMKKSEEPAEAASSSWSSLLQMQPPLFAPLDSTLAALSLSPSESTTSQSTLSSWKSSSSGKSSSQSSMTSELSTASELSTDSSNRRLLEQRVQRAREYFASLPPIYDEKGVHIASGTDMCDCLKEQCPGCFFPCPKCASKKCGTKCRVKRQSLVEYIDDGKKIVKNPLLPKEEE